MIHEAISLHVHLPAAARRSLRAILASGDPGVHIALGRDVARAIVRSAFDHARIQASETALHAYPCDVLTSEDDADQEAARLVRTARASAG